MRRAAPVIEGYTAEFSLTKDEVQALWPLVRLRLCMSVCIAAHQQAHSRRTSTSVLVRHSSRKRCRDFWLRIATDDTNKAETLAARRRLLGGT
jgi:Ser/Thr protein kinase RdoA (MazF antagonist)